MLNFVAFNKSERFLFAIKLIFKSFILNLISTNLTKIINIIQYNVE